MLVEAKTDMYPSSDSNLMEKPTERTIHSFPLAYNTDATPYRKFRFDASVREFCDRDVMTPKNHLRVAKCVIVGDIAVGKTTLINRFAYNVFNNNYKATIGVDFDVQKFNILDIPFNLQIWDTAGQERFKCITSTYYRGAHVAVIVFDLSNVSSLASTKKWYQDVMASNSLVPPLIFLVGTKREMLRDSTLDYVEDQAIQVAKELGAEYWSLSSRTGQGVEPFFNRVSVLTFQEMVHREINASRIDRPLVYSNKFIKLKKQKGCKKFWSFSCARL